MKDYTVERGGGRAECPPSIHDLRLKSSAVEH